MLVPSTEQSVRRRRDRSGASMPISSSTVGNDVAHVVVLRADLARRPRRGAAGHEMMNGSRMPPACVLLLVPLERRVGRHRPTRRVHRARRRATDLVEAGHELLGRRRCDAVRVLHVVERAVLPALARRPVVGDEHDDVSPRPRRIRSISSSTRPIWASAWLEETGVGLHQSGRDLLLGRRHVDPRPHVGVARRELTVVGHDPEQLLAQQALVAKRIPTLVVAPAVVVDELARRVQRIVRGAEAQVHEERLLRVHRSVVAEHGDRLGGEIFAEVVAVVARRIDRVVVRDEIGSPLVGRAVEKPVEAVEPALQRPMVVGPDRGHLVGGREVPLADRVRVVPVAAAASRRACRHVW